MDEKIRQIVQEELAKQKSTDTFSYTQTTQHTHNGIDSPKINLANAVYNNKFISGITANDGGGIEVLTYGIYNPSCIMFYGIATGGGGERAVITGNAQLGNCFNDNNTATISQNIVQSCISTYKSGNNFTLHLGGLGIAFVEDEHTNVVATLSVTDFSNTSISFSSTLSAGWEIVGNIIIS